MLSTFWEIYLLKPRWEVSQIFEESLQGSKLVNNLEIMLKNDQTIIEFGFRMMRRIIQMEENIWGGKQPLKSV